MLCCNGIHAAVRVGADVFSFPQQFDAITTDPSLVRRCSFAKPFFSSQKLHEKASSPYATGLVELSIQHFVVELKD